MKNQILTGAIALKNAKDKIEREKNTLATEYIYFLVPYIKRKIISASKKGRVSIYVDFYPSLLRTPFKFWFNRKFHYENEEYIANWIANKENGFLGAEGFDITFNKRKSYFFITWNNADESE